MSFRTSYPMKQHGAGVSTRRGRLGALVLAAAVCHATWNYLVKRVNGGPELVWLFSFLAALLYLPLAVAGLVIEQPVMGWREIAVCVASALLHLGYFLLLQQGYRRGDLSLVYPTARATGPFLSTFFAVVFLGEVSAWPLRVAQATFISPSERSTIRTSSPLRRRM